MSWTAESLPIAIVGTRNITPYGREVTELLAGELVALGATIVSGLMYGVDSVAHLTAVKCAGSTIAVLGYGFDHCYPEEHRPVMEELLARGATLLSEYPPLENCQTWQFSSPQQHRGRHECRRGGDRGRAKEWEHDHRRVCGGGRAGSVRGAGTDHQSVLRRDQMADQSRSNTSELRRRSARADLSAWTH